MICLSEMKPILASAKPRLVPLFALLFLGLAQLLQADQLLRVREARRCDLETSGLYTPLFATRAVVGTRARKVPKRIREVPGLRS